MGAIVKNDSPNVKVNGQKKEAIWQKYQAIATAGGIPANRLQWCEKWARQFADVYRDVPLAERTVEHVRSFLAMLSTHPAMQLWQLKQAQDAVRPSLPGSDQDNLLIFKNYRPINSRFSALWADFQVRNRLFC